MRHFAIGLLAFLWIDHAMAQEHLRISSDWGSVTAELADNDAARALIEMLPIAIDMRDHLRQEKTGNLPSPLPEIPGNEILQQARLGSGGPITFLFTTPRAVCRSQELPFLAP